jgi:uroporphyrinogen decarboxylase
MTMNARERMMACIKNDPSMDRPPVALWRHFPVDDQEPVTLAAATVDFQDHYGFDLVKVTPASSFSVKDWGVEDNWEGCTEGTRRYTKYPIQKPQDWESLKTLDPRKSRHLSDQIECLRLIRSTLGTEVPVLQTIFNPLTQAKHLAGNEMLFTHLRKYPEALNKGLKTIAETTCRFIEAAMETGIDGIFFAIQHAQATLLSLDEYKTYGLAFDRLAIKPASGLWCNLLHLHGMNIYFDLFTKSVFFEGMFQIINWHDCETPPSLQEGKALFPGIVCGGISQRTIVYENASQVHKEAENAIRQTGGRRLLLGTGCVVPVIAPHGNILMARQIVEAS